MGKVKSIKKMECEKKTEKKKPLLYLKKEDCCGCNACVSVCPVSAIEMKYDEEGFEYPIINYEKCVKCYGCEKCCPIKLMDACKEKNKVESVHPMIKIIVATHKKFRMPEEKIYLPVHVGAEGKELDFGYQKDDESDNISYKNSNYCELTGLYWAWKNLDADYIGLVHYRRYFASMSHNKKGFDRILNETEVRDLLSNYKIIVPKKRRYYIETLYSHYKHTHYAEQLDLTREIVKSLYPEYIQSFDKIMRRTYGYMFNMMIMEKDLLNKYCIWLFDILFTLEKKIEMPDLSFYQGRFYGRISEIIFNVWLDYQVQSGNLKITDIKEVPYMHMEKINWIKKGSSFLRAKFFKKKYDGSF